jgi:branched-chain amino acid transport system substrate-binding protein
MRNRISAIAITALTIALAGCGDGGGGGEDSEEPFVIGVTAARSGAAATFGAAQFDAAQLATEEINAAGGINGRKIELVTEDDEGAPDKGASITQRFISRGVDAILGTASSGVALASVPIAEDAEMLYLAPMPANATITRTEDGGVRKWIFRVAQSDTDNAQFLADFTFGKYSRVALLSDTTGYGAGGRQSLKTYIGGQGKSLVADETYATGAPDVTAQLQRIAAADADVLVLWGVHTDAATILKALRGSGSELPVVGLPALGGTVMCDLAGDAAVGLHYLDTFDPQNAKASELSGKWQSKYGKPITSYFAPAAYDGMYLLANALKAGGDDKEAVRQALESTSTYQGALGKAGIGISYGADDHDGLSKDGILVKRITNATCDSEPVA